MGYWQGPDRYNTPDPVEYVRIRGDQLVPRDGLVELRVTNELEEAVFFDQLELTAVAHPEDMEVHPNEGMTPVPKPHRLHGVRHPRVPAWALDDDGTDVTDVIAERDRRYPEGFALTAIRGYAAPHTLTLDLGRLDEPSVLLLTGWTDYAFSSDNVAAFQAGLTPTLPTLEIKDTFGRWRPGVEIGIPVGRPQTIAIDLSDVLRPGERVVRIVTSMRIYWDQIPHRVTGLARGARRAASAPGPRRAAAARLLGGAAPGRHGAHHLRLRPGDTDLALEDAGRTLHPGR